MSGGRRLTVGRRLWGGAARRRALRSEAEAAPFSFSASCRLRSDTKSEMAIAGLSTAHVLRGLATPRPPP